MHFDICDKNDASFFAGILIAAFSLAESLTGMLWGCLSDRIGRKPVLLLGSAGTALSLLLVGFSTNLWMAVAARLLGGLLNGNMGVAQSMVAELVKRPEHEPRAYSILPFVWSMGSIVGPAIGGYFAEPRNNFPRTFRKGSMFTQFPYLLPNLICVLILCVGIVLGIFFLEETHPDVQPRATSEDIHSPTPQTPLVDTDTMMENAPIVQHSTAYGTLKYADEKLQDEWIPCVPTIERPAAPLMAVNLFDSRILMLVAALGIFTYHSMTFDHLLPIFLQDDRTPTPLHSGLGLSTQAVGILMSVNGMVAMFVQGVIFPVLASLIGLPRLFLFVTILHPLVYLSIPLLTLLPTNLLLPGIYSALIIRNFLSIIAYPIYLIFIKDAAPSPSSLGRINGLAASTGAACRTLASPAAGLLYSIGAGAGFSPLPWFVSAAVAVLGAIQIILIHRRQGLVASAHMEHDEHNALSTPKKDVSVTVRRLSTLSSSDIG